ncbi:MAG: hypothetical protein JWP45_1973 [Mucilaginibacter sp.]|nr:hypothetical protein [Mucilaginibacter sp.]
MKQKVILSLLALAILSAFFIPVQQQETISVKSSFLNIYSLLAKPDKWQKWRSDLLKVPLADSDKISIKKDTGSFIIKYAPHELNVAYQGNSFGITENNNDKTINYSYVIIPDTGLTRTLITVYKKINLARYLFGMFKPVSFSDTHVTDLKNFMETDSLRYGYRIFKTRVPEANLIVIRRPVLAKDRFTEAAKMLSALQIYTKTHNVRQTQPLIAQFLPKGKDSAQVNIGFFIDRETTSYNDITFMRMPKGGPLYSARFSGQFNKRQSVYDGIGQYFIDHKYQSTILPFETYLDNKLPATDTDKVNIQVNFTTYF